MIYKRGSIYWTKFQHAGRMIYKSTGQTSGTKARQVEARLRSELAMGNFGILAKKAIPTLAEFIGERIEPRAQATPTSAGAGQKRFQWLRTALMPLTTNAIGRLPLDKITSEHVSGYILDREGLAVGTINRELRALRRIVRLAVEWGVLEKAPKISMAGSEPFRERVVGDEEFERYLRCAPPLLADVAALLYETGLRPDEAHRLDWTDIAFVNGRHGRLRVRFGKTDAAKRELPLTPRVRTMLQRRWQNAGCPSEGWIFPAETDTGHIDHDSTKKQHAKALRLSGVVPFVIYSLRHSFATKIAPFCDAWTLCKIMGWSSLSVAMRYIHPGEDRVLAAFAKPLLSGTGDKSGDSALRASVETIEQNGPK
jgi:integrase